MPDVKSRHALLERGQSFVELSLGMVFFLFFVLGLLDLGRLYFLYVALEDSAGEAALYLALNASCPGPPGDAVCSSLVDGCPAKCADPNNAKSRATNASGLIDFTRAGTKMAYIFSPATETSEEMVEVKLSYPFELMTPIISQIVGSETIVLHSNASQTLLAK